MLQVLKINIFIYIDKYVNLFFLLYNHNIYKKKSHILEKLTLSTNAATSPELHSNETSHAPPPENPLTFQQDSLAPPNR